MEIPILLSKINQSKIKLDLGVQYVLIKSHLLYVNTFGYR